MNGIPDLFLIIVADAAGNQTVSEYTFTVDDRKADILDAAAKIGEKQVTVIWICKDVSAVSRFRVTRKIGAAGKEKHVTDIYPAGKDTFSAADTDLTVSGSYIYSITAFMTNGNIVSCTLDPLAVQAIPHAELECQTVQTAGKEYAYDATGSGKADDIISVKISFGDGTTAEKKSVQNASFTHTFEKAGTYEVALIVTNASGMSDTKKVNVTVAEPDNMSTVVATVNKMDGSPFKGVRKEH